MTAYKWSFYFSDSEGKAHRFEIRAVNSAEAVSKALKCASRNAEGEICSWNCCLKAVNP